MTMKSLIKRVRRLIQDEEEPYHWSDGKLKDDLQSAFDALIVARPETRYVNSLLVDRVVAPSDVDENIPVDERFAESVAYYGAYMAYSDDCTDPVSKSLADDFLNKFNTMARM